MIQLKGKGINTNERNHEIKINTVVDYTTNLMKIAEKFPQNINIANLIADEENVLVPCDSMGLTYLHYACKHPNSFNLISLLIDKKCDLNVADRYKSTPFMVYVHHNKDLNVIKFMIEKKGDPSVPISLFAQENVKKKKKKKFLKFIVFRKEITFLSC